MRYRQDTDGIHRHDIGTACVKGRRKRTKHGTQEAGGRWEHPPAPPSSLLNIERTSKRHHISSAAYCPPPSSPLLAPPQPV